MIDLSQLKPGQVVVVNGKTYARCSACQSIVRVDKWLIGSAHLCVQTTRGAG